jgi:hypothetical protein
MQKNLLQTLHQAITNEIEKTRFIVSKNQNHPFPKGKITLGCHKFGRLEALFKVLF